MKHLYRQLTWPEARDRAAAGTVVVIPVAAIEQLVRIAKELGREIATGKEAREMYKLDEHWGSTDEAGIMSQLGLA